MKIIKATVIIGTLVGLGFGISKIINSLDKYSFKLRRSIISKIIKTGIIKDPVTIEELEEFLREYEN